MPTAPLWCLTYSDLLTNILCFFVVMLMFATFGVKKSSIQKPRPLEMAFEHPMGTPRNDGVYQWLVSGGKGILLMPNPRNISDVSRIVRRVKNQVQSVKMLDQVLVTGDRQGVKIRIPSRVMFQSGSASLKPEADQILNALVPVIGELKHFIRIDSHCDDKPAKSSAFPTNWEMSSARACAVLRYFTEKKGLDAGRFSAQGFADFRPEVETATGMDQENNRRVEIMILTSKPQKNEEYQWD